MAFDTIVVGAGSAGAILAARLSEDLQRSILLLEAGPDYPDMEQMPEEIKYGYGKDRNMWARALGHNSKYSWNFIARPNDSSRTMLVPRGRITGGTSAINVQIFLRGVRDDYDTWASMGNDRWSFEQLLPYFRKLESDLDYHDEFHGTDGPVIVRRFKEQEWNRDQHAFYAACRAAGYPDCPDHNRPDSTGVGPLAFNDVDGIRWSTAIAYLNPARHRVNLTIRPNSVVHRVLFDDQRAVGVLVESGGELVPVYGDQIVLSAGSIGSPHLLMLSGIGEAEQLEGAGIRVVEDLPGVGQNLRDHPQVAITWKIGKGFQQDWTSPRIQLALRYTARGSDLQNDMYVVVASLVPDRGHYYTTNTEPRWISLVPHINLEEGAGEVRLVSADPHEQPLLRYNFLQEAVDRERMREAVRICVQLGEHPEYTAIVEERTDPTDVDLDSDDTLDNWLMKRVATSHHITSTCKMGPSSDSMAVVDQYGKVRGVDGLRVADASIMPNCIRANTNSTTMVIGERMADFLREGL